MLKDLSLWGTVMYYSCQKCAWPKNLSRDFVPVRKTAGICVKLAVVHIKQQSTALVWQKPMWSGYVVEFQFEQWAGEWNVTLNFVSHGTVNTLHNSSVGWSQAQGVYRAWITCEMMEISERNRTSFPYLLPVVGDFVNNTNSSRREVLRMPSSWKLIISFAAAGISGSDGICFKLSDHTKTHFELWHPPSC